MCRAKLPFLADSTAIFKVHGTGCDELFKQQRSLCHSNPTERSLYLFLIGWFDALQKIVIRRLERKR